MRIQIKPRLSYANVVSTLCLFVVLGGGAYATHTHRMGTQDLRNNAVTAPKIRGGAVTAQNLRNHAVRPRKVATGAIRRRHVLDEAITTAKIADGAVTAQKLAGDVGPGGTPTGPAGGDLTGHYPNPLIADEAVTTEKIADEAVRPAQIEDTAVTTPKIAPLAVGHAKLANGAVRAAKLGPIVQRFAQSPIVGHGAVTNVVAPCPPGSVLISGGYFAGANWRVSASFRTANGWSVTGRNLTGGNAFITAQAVCLTA